VEIDLAKVPKRETGMIPYEIMLSESQERMLIIVEKGKEQTVKDIFEKWDLPYAEVGTVKDDGMMRVLDGGSLAAEIPAKQLADDAPVYERVQKARPTPDPIDTRIASRGGLPRCPPQAPRLSEHRIEAVGLASVRSHGPRRDVCASGSDAAVFLIREANKIVAATSDCNALYCALDPRNGARIAVAEAARNLTCAGAVPLAVTDNLNFGNPHNPENFWQLAECVEGLAEGCREFQHARDWR
jgi:phosphoribosylformylglycinamidine synthase